MKKMLTFAFLLFVFTSLKAEQNTIAKIFDGGKAIELNNGSIWGIGYWSWNNYYDHPIVNQDWQVGDSLEFFSRWKGVPSKPIFIIKNVRSEQMVRGWLYQAPRQESLLVVKDVDPSSGMITLEDGSKWQATGTHDFHLHEVIWEKKVYLLKKLQGNFYLCRANSEEPKAIEVVQVQDSQENNRID